MAGRNVGATLSLNQGNFFTKMKSAVNASNNLKKTLSGTTSGLKGFGSQSSATGNILTSLASKAAVAVGAFMSIRSAINFGKDVVNTGMEFEQGMANVSAISGATGDELKALSEKAKEMGAATKFSAIEASDAMKYMAMAGWNSSQMIDGISGIMNLAAASGEDLASVSDIVTDSLTAFGLQAKDSAEFADILAVASSKSNTNVAMLGESFKNVAPVAGAMGYSVRDTTVALGLMANAGIKSSDAGTSLRSVMTRLAKPTADVSKALNELGIEVTAADGSMKPLNQLIPELQTKFAGLTESERGQYATMIAGKNAMSGFLSIVNSSPADFQALTDAINDSEGAAQKMADTMNDTVQGKLTLLKSQFEGVKIAIFDALGSSQFKNVLQSVSDGLAAITPYVTTLTVAIGNGLFSAIQTIYNIGTTVFSAVKTAVENNRPAIDNVISAFDNLKTTIVNAFSGDGTRLIQTLADVIVPSLCNTLAFAANAVSAVISVARPLAPLIAGIAGAIGVYKAMVIACTIAENAWAVIQGVVTAVQWAMNIAMDANPIGIIILAIGGLIAIGVALWQNWDTIKEKMMALWDGIKNVFGKIKDFVVGAWNTVKEKTSEVWNGIKGAVSEKAEGIKNAISEKLAPVKEAFGNALNSAKSVVQDKLNNIKSAYEEHGGGIKGVAAGAIEAVKGYYTAGYDFINNLTGGKLGQVVDSVKEKLSPMVNAVKDKLSGLKDAFASGFSNAVNFIKTSYNGGALKPVVDKIISVFGNVKNAIADKFNGIKDAIADKLKGIADAFTGITQSIADKFTAVKDAVAEKFNGIKDVVAAKLSSIGEAAVGLKDKIAEKFIAVKDAIAEKFSAVKSAVVNILSPLKAAVGDVIGGIKTVVSSVVGGIRDVVVGIITNIKNTVSNIVSGIRDNISAFIENIRSSIQGIWNGVQSYFEGIKTVITGVFQTIVGVFTGNVETIKTGVETVKNGITTAFEGAKTIVLNVWNAIKSAATLVFENIKTVVTNAISGIKNTISTVTGTVSSVFNSVRDTIFGVFESVKSKVVSVFENVKNTVKNAIDKIKGFFKFTWELPKIKLPHFSISPAGWQIGDLLKGSIPKLGIEWYAKGGIMQRPTMFGLNGNNAMVGGEAGAEAILPLTEFWKRLEEYFKPQPTPQPIPAVNNYITVNVDGRSADDETLANKVAHRIVEVIENM